MYTWNLYNLTNHCHPSKFNLKRETKQIKIKLSSPSQASTHMPVWAPLRPERSDNCGFSQGAPGGDSADTETVPNAECCHNKTQQ